MPAQPLWTLGAGSCYCFFSMHGASEGQTRRRWLELGVWGFLAAIGAAVGGVFVAAASAPAWVKRPQRWLPAAPLDQLTDQPQRFDVEYDLRQGWHQQRRRDVVYAFRDESGQPVVLSSVCTHLGCAVRWEPKSKRFECPCHGGVYDAQGNVLAGPPERPLERPELQLEGATVLIKKT